MQTDKSVLEAYGMCRRNMQWIIHKSMVLSKHQKARINQLKKTSSYKKIKISL